LPVGSNENEGHHEMSAVEDERPLQEADLRPTHLLAEYDRLYAKDLRWLLERRQEFTSEPCPACQQQEHRLRFEKGGFDFVECVPCGTLYVEPRPTRAILDAYYTSGPSVLFWDTYICASSEEARRHSLARPRALRVVELCERHGASNGKVVDVGCGNGTFCEELQKTAFFREVSGVEPAQEAAAACRRKGISVIERPIEHVGIDDASVITSFELIEHLHRPRDFVVACAKALMPGGLLILTTPNIRGFDLMTLGALSDNIAGPAHLNYFHPESLARLLTDCGLEVLESLTPGRLDAEIVRKKALAGVLDLSQQPFLQTLLIDRWDSLGASFQAYLSANGLSSHLWMVARRP
jgi:2-polyprenyl-3-methyl-5-hydroxy-6-metoxy-1,4-benzoquinol methylase/Zn ribbon nucleic-acid-binding protein